jgi:hypothetical protein
MTELKFSRQQQQALQEVKRVLVESLNERATKSIATSTVCINSSALLDFDEVNSSDLAVLFESRDGKTPHGGDPLQTYNFQKMRQVEFPEVQPVPGGWCDGIRDAGHWYRTERGHRFKLEWSKLNEVDWWLEDQVFGDKYQGKGRQTLRAAIGLILTRFVKAARKQTPKRKPVRPFWDSDDECAPGI